MITALMLAYRKWHHARCFAWDHCHTCDSPTYVKPGALLDSAVQILTVASLLKHLYGG